MQNSYDQAHEKIAND